MDRETRESVCAVAAAVLSREVGSLDGCRKLLAILSRTDLFERADPLYQTLSMAASETDTYPATQAERDLWNPEALEKHEALGRERLRDAKLDIEQACEELLGRFRD